MRTKAGATSSDRKALPPQTSLQPSHALPPPAGPPQGLQPSPGEVWEEEACTAPPAQFPRAWAVHPGKEVGECLRLGSPHKSPPLWASVSLSVKWGWTSSILQGVVGAHRDNAHGEGDCFVILSQASHLRPLLRCFPFTPRVCTCCSLPLLHPSPT